MATLQIEFNCLCLFVRDETNHIVHVLMPSTHPPHKHVVMLYHHTAFPGGHPMEGLEWVLGTGGTADLLSLAPTADGVIVDLTKVTEDAAGQNGKKVADALVSTAHTDVLTRVTLRAGSVVARNSEATWRLKGVEVAMAHQVIWEIDGVLDTLTWNPLNNPDPAPLATLSELGAPERLPGGKQGYPLRVFHTMPGNLPPNEIGVLNEAQVRQHFQHFYDVLHHQPDPDQLPSVVAAPAIGTFNCGTGQAAKE